MEKNRSYYVKQLQKTELSDEKGLIGAAIGMLAAGACASSGVLIDNMLLMNVSSLLVGATGLGYGIYSFVSKEKRKEAESKISTSRVSISEFSLLNDFKSSDVYKRRKALKKLIDLYDYTVEEISVRTGISTAELNSLLNTKYGEDLREISFNTIPDSECIKRLSSEDKFKCEKLEKGLSKAVVATTRAKDELDSLIRELDDRKNIGRIAAEEYRKIILELTDVYASYLNSENALRDELKRIYDNGRQMLASEDTIYHLTRKAINHE